MVEENKLPELKLGSGISLFLQNPTHDPRAVRIFDRRDYYTSHGENATFIAMTYYHTTTALRQLGGGADGLSSVSINKNMFETIARDLLLERTDHTLELYEGSGSNWRLAKSGTPGNLGSFEDVLFANNEMQDSPVVVALIPNFRENGCTVFNECRTLHDALTRCGVLTERKKSEFKTRDLVQDLGRLVKGSIEPVRDLVSGFEFAPGALGALLSYAELLAAGMGKRLLHMWLKQPLLDVNEINSRLDLSSIRLPYIRSALERYDGQFSSLIKERYLDPLESLTDDDHLNKFVALVEASVDLDQLENGEYMISPNYDPALSALKDEQESLERQIHNLHKQTANDLDLPQDKGLKLDKGTQFGHVFRITKKEEPKIRKKLTTQFIVLETRKDGVKFTNTKLKKLGDQYQKIVEEYKNCQKELVNRVIQTAATFSEVFESLAGMLSELDVLLSFADLASSCPTPYTRPDISPSVRGKSWFQIITGPNMGGKSTFIRQVGVNILMAQVGSFVPCDKASISVRDCIFARVGAGDCQLRGVSTFMQEMLETASILKGATDKSLIIIDELGRGTSTYDGFGLAWAICEHLVQVIKAPTLFATHFHELTALADEKAESHTKHIVGVANYHVSAHIDLSNCKLTMLYKVEPGACDQSFGIHVAEFANFPKSVVALAREKAAELEDFSPNAIFSNDTAEKVLAVDGRHRVGQCGNCDVPSVQKRILITERLQTTPFMSNLTKLRGIQTKKICDLEDMSRGAAHAHRFLKAFSDLPLETMDLKEALHQVSKLKDDLERDAANCRWLKQFF
ncbi:hypothetical protein GH714_027909 [Hevea brasiliensis]|uniref:DNA mismatch repair protein MSH2 n=1 Tax=Hevea brasiliensis TaxID=3981 RepID=A0A6A6LFB2_HEVBR|nr:hypothetical protein GH714_027909 [Hevea brasiliensis]